MTRYEINEIQKMLNGLSGCSLLELSNAIALIDVAIEAFKFDRFADGLRTVQRFYCILHGSEKFNEQIRERLLGGDNSIYCHKCYSALASYESVVCEKCI
jgi:hypothetical protein